MRNTGKDRRHVVDKSFQFQRNASRKERAEHRKVKEDQRGSTQNWELYDSSIED